MPPLWLIASFAPLVADTPPPLIVASASPRGVTPALSSAALLTAVQGAAPAPLVVRTPEQVGLDIDALLACPLDRRLSCWTTRAAAAAEDAVLLVVSFVPSRGGTTYTGVLIDVRSEAAADDRSENAIYGRAPRFDRSAVARDALPEALSADVARALAPIVARRDDLQAWGEITLTAEPDQTLRIDGRAVGVTRDATTVRLRPGTRRVVLGELERVVQVPPAGRVEVDLRPALEHPMHAVSAWSGAGVAVLGAVVLVAAAATNTDRRYALDRTDPESRWVDTCDLFGGCAGGVPLAPLGAALLGAGATTGATYGVVASGAEYAWWWAAIGVGVGVLTYGVMAAAN